MMNRYYGMALVTALLMLLASGPAMAQISVSLPSAQAEVGEEFVLDVTVQDLTGQNVLAYEFDIEYDAAVLSFSGISLEGTLSAGKTVIANVAQAGIIRVAAASATAFEGGGSLLKIEGSMLSDASSDLTFTKFRFNEGEPEATTTNGEVSSPSNVAAEDGTEIPSEFALQGNYPNPFNPATTIRFDLPESADVSVRVFNMLGHEVLALPAQAVAAGNARSIQIDGANLSSGTYLYRVTAKGANTIMSETGTMTLIK